MKSYMCRMALMLVCLGSGWTLAARAADAPAPGKAEAKTRLTEGQPAPAFSLASTDGKTASPADYKGRIAHIFYGVTVNKHAEEVVDALRKLQAEAEGR